MPISKIVFKSNPSAAPEVWMDATPATAAAADIVSPKTAMLANGVLTTGTGSGGGSATLITKNITANGTYDASDDSADGYSEVTVAVPSRVVIGTFTGTTGGTGQSISVPYTGSGHPVTVTIYPSTGARKSGDAMSSLVDWYAIIAYSAVKEDMSTAPTYSGEISSNFMSVYALYKGSESDPTATNANRLVNATSYIGWSVYDDLEALVRFSNSTTMNVYIKEVGNGYYGFAQGIEYTYNIVYSE